MTHFRALAVLKNNKGYGNYDWDLEDLMGPYSEYLKVPEYVSMTRSEFYNMIMECTDNVIATISDIQNEIDNLPENDEKTINHKKSILKNQKDWLDRIFEGKPVEEFRSEPDDVVIKRYAMLNNYKLNENGDVLSTYNPDTQYDYYGEMEDMTGDAYKKYFFSKEHEYDIPYAVVDENGWHSPGKVGWFGTSSATKDEEKAWFDETLPEYIKGLTENDYVVLLDCHI